MPSPAVLDTNALVSAALGGSSPPRWLLEAAEQGHFELITSPKQLYELEAVLSRPYMVERLSSQDRTDLIDWVTSVATMWLDPRRSAALTENPDDDYLIALAQISGATLVTGDFRIHRDHPEGLVVLSPREFYEQLGT